MRANAEQGGLALLVMKDGGGLVRTPVIPAGANRLERHIESELDAAGAVSGSIREQSSGVMSCMMGPAPLPCRGSCGLTWAPR